MYLCSECNKPITGDKTGPVLFEYKQDKVYYGCIYCDRFKILERQEFSGITDWLSTAIKLGLQKEEYTILGNNLFALHRFEKRDDGAIEKVTVKIGKKEFNKFLKDFVYHCGHNKHKSNKQVIGFDHIPSSYHLDCRKIDGNVNLVSKDVPLL